MRFLKKEEEEKKSGLDGALVLT